MSLRFFAVLQCTVSARREMLTVSVVYRCLKSVGCRYLLVVHDGSQNLVDIEEGTGPLECSICSVGARPLEITERQWLAHREPSESANDPFRHYAAWTVRWDY